VRWPHPERGMISPADFHSRAEETGLITPLGGLNASARLPGCRAMAGDGPRRGQSVAGAVSRRQPVVDVMDALKQSRPAGETAGARDHRNPVARDKTSVWATLHALPRSACGFDDAFGTAFQPELLTQAFRVDKIKIDQSFVRRPCRNPTRSDHSFHLSLGKGLGVIITAEGSRPGGN